MGAPALEDPGFFLFKMSYAYTTAWSRAIPVALNDRWSATRPRVREENDEERHDRNRAPLPGLQSLRSSAADIANGVVQGTRLTETMVANRFRHQPRTRTPGRQNPGGSPCGAAESRGLAMSWRKADRRTGDRRIR